ncbi:GNAT family N-acetyltransferase [Ochrobactrum pecoris]|uniref:GNAT family N-acetyltransferase n=1 Tax=Brucella pecoris TaxID=867683 RepID=A0A5C5CFE5_9HYPH|nr:GNAT family N-acetyltransferase [Brucella pecoris]MBB4094199.1 RimJ/RimL family protein N-acetyltransferase [Brucella pecoris]NKW79988.1 GNAT family N-acetyltransferase [Brucella pecoris]TNV09931.1 GNAT family N-acetyltransferase [Brucella pecoris]
MIILETARLVIRNWEDRDRDLFHVINSDEEVMRFFPFRRDRSQSDELFDSVQKMISETGLGFYALEEKEGGQCIGFAGLSRTDLEPHLPDGTVEIGWRLATPFWGKGYVTEAGKAIVEYAFGTLGLTEVVSFAVQNNDRSTAVMQRIGMTRDTASDFDHPRVPDETPHLKRHAVYRIQAA